MSVEEAECEAEFATTVRRDEEGRFVVALPKKRERMQQLGNSYETALIRFNALNRRLNAYPEIRFEYEQFLKEYLELGHM